MLARLGTLLIVLGLGAIAYGILWQLGLAPGSRVTLPEPVALGRAAPGAREVFATPPPAPSAVPTAPLAHAPPSMAAPAAGVPTTPASVATGAPASAGTGAPASAATGAPASAGTGAPASAATGAPVSAATGAPVSAATGAPAVGVPTTPASVATGARASAATGAPAVPADAGSQPALAPAPARPIPSNQTPVPPATVSPMAAADAVDRVDGPRPGRAGYAVRLAIPAIKVDTVVEQAGIVQDAHGDPVWQTVPFVAVHYGALTSMIGVPGNAVIAGHVVTLSEGNVFRFLYQLDLGDQIDVWDQLAREHDFQVVDVKLVPPSDTSVMDPTPDETLTLITCGGTFDPAKREFSDRLIVTAKPL